MSKSIVRMHRGGVAGMRGSDFERYFATYRLLLAVDEMERREQVRFAVQLKNARVDDWVEDRRRSRAHFQLKRVKKLNWSTVRTDFEAQKRSRPKGKTLELQLVVPTKKLARKLRSARRPVPRVGVDVFPGWMKPDQYVRTKGKVRNALVSSCVLDTPTNSDLEMIWKDVSFAWENARSPGHFVRATQVLERLRDHQTPVRRAWSETPAWTRARKHLDRVGGMSVEVRSGTLFYSTGSGIAGRISCRSRSFRKFVAAVNRERPKNLKSVLELL